MTTATDIKFVDELPRSTRARASKLERRWGDVLTALKENPGKWAEIVNEPRDLSTEGKRAEIRTDRGARTYFRRHGVEVTSRSSAESYRLFARAAA